MSRGLGDVYKRQLLHGFRSCKAIGKRVVKRIWSGSSRGQKPKHNLRNFLIYQDFIMCNRQFTKMLPLKPEIYEALLKQDELDRRQLRPKDYYSEDIFNPRR